MGDIDLCYIVYLLNSKATFYYMLRPGIELEFSRITIKQ